ncbi:hypothetical protein [Novilysobacter spongiicola]|uniref:hypothetical protein n=1 Tax=Novilysobacter spongiicola TaxID=435289 RepID=UPI003CCD3A8B
MEADPVAALGEYGFDIDPEIAPSKVELPSKQAIAENAELLSRQIEATSAWIVFCR